MKITRTFDPDKVASVILDEESARVSAIGRARIASEQQIREQANNDNNILLLCDDGAGLVGFQKLEDKTKVRVHATFKRGHRLGYAKTCLYMTGLALFDAMPEVKTIIGDIAMKRFDLLLLVKALGGKIQKVENGYTYEITRETICLS